MATLGVMYVARGVALLMTNGLTYNNLGGRPELGNTGFDWLGFNRCSACPSAWWSWLSLRILGSLVLNRTAFGRWLYASGGNERAAELSGVPVKAVQMTVYVLVGYLRRHRRPDPVLAADFGRADRRHHPTN